MRKILFAVCVMVCLAGCAHSKPPVSEQVETDVLLYIDEAAMATKENLNAFHGYVIPYAPLDFNPGRSLAFEKASYLKNGLLGYSAGASQLTPDDVRSLIAEFNCGDACLDAYRDALKQKLPEIESFVKEFNRYPGVTILSVYPGGIRINDLFYIAYTNLAVEYKPEKKSGVIPGLEKKRFPSPSEYLAENNLPEDKIFDLFTTIHTIDFTAAVKSDTGTRIILLGIGDNEAGLIFSNQPVTTGQKTFDARELIYVEKLKDGVYFYQST